MRAAEAQAASGMFEEELMDRAAAAVAEVVFRVAAGRPVLFLCGPGNNGADGMYAAHILRSLGHPVRVATVGSSRTPLGREATKLWQDDAEILTGSTRGAPVVVDAVFGIGQNRAIDISLARTLARLRSEALRTLAIDVPTGVNADTGELLGIESGVDITIALGALKPAHVLLPAAELCGTVVVKSIGIALPDTMRTVSLHHDVTPSPHAHKYSRGHVLVIGGEMAGASALAARGALRAGAGYVTLATEPGAAQAMMMPSAIVAQPLAEWERLASDRRTDVIVLGPGLESRQAPGLVRTALAVGKPTVLDAAAVPAFAAMTSAGGAAQPIILTPHSAEFDRAFPQLTGSKIARTQEAARRTGAVIIHKGADTILAAPDGRVIGAWPGSPWLASAGSGDVLAGACAAMLARGMDPLDAAEAAVAWHIAAARRVGPGLIADDLVSGT